MTAKNKMKEAKFELYKMKQREDIHTSWELACAEDGVNARNKKDRDAWQSEMRGETE